MTVYTNRRASLVDAQRLIDGHATSSAGRCQHCDVYGPCPAWVNGTRIFEIRRALPQRRPGATRPERTNARRIF